MRCDIPESLMIAAQVQCQFFFDWPGTVQRRRAIGAGKRADVKSIGVMITPRIDRGRGLLCPTTSCGFACRGTVRMPVPAMGVLVRGAKMHVRPTRMLGRVLASHARVPMHGAKTLVAQ